MPAVAASRVDVGLGGGDHRPGVLDVGPHPLDVGLGGRDGGPGVLDVRPHLLDVGALVEDLGLGALEVGGGGVDLGLEDVRVDPRDQLIPADRGVEVDEDLAGSGRTPGCPTWTVVTAFRAPVAETVATIVPRSTVAVRNRVAGVRLVE